MKLTSILFWLLVATTASAQWQSVTCDLKAGWNAIYLHGEAVHATPEVLFGSAPATSIEEVWRWNPNPNEVQFTETPLITSAGTPEWAKWVRGAPTGNTLSDLKGQAGYLVKCSADAMVAIIQKVLPPSATWMRTGANLLGFPAKTNGTNPKFSSYFATFPAAIAANAKIYKYVGGDLGPSNPLQVFSPTFETLDRNQAYWFSSQVVGNFYAPLEISLSNASGIAFGKTASVVTALIRNRTDGAVTLTMAESASAAPPAGQTAIQGVVPLTLGKIVGVDWNYDDPITGTNNTVVIGPQSTVELRFGVNRAHASMTSAPDDALFASLLRLTESSNLMDIYMPVTANKASLAGLWAGEVVVDRVGAVATGTATVSGGAVTSITVGDAGYGYPSTTLVTVPSTAGLAKGDTVSGAGIGASATIREIVNATQLKVSVGLADGTQDLSFGAKVVRSTAAAPLTTVTVASTVGLAAGTSVSGSGISDVASILAIMDDTRFLLSDSIPDATNDLSYDRGIVNSTSVTSGVDQVSLVTLPSTADIAAGGTLTTSDGAGFNGKVLSVIDRTHVVIGGRQSPPYSTRIAEGAYNFSYYQPSGSLLGGFRPGSAVTIFATTVTVPSTEGLQTGDFVTGGDISGSAYAVEVIDGTSFYLSQNIADATQNLGYSRVASSVSSAGTATQVTVGSTAGLSVGTPVTGTGITGTAVVASILNGTQYVLSETIPDATNSLSYGTTVKSATADTNIITTSTVPSTSAVSGSTQVQIVVSSSTGASLLNRVYPITSTVDATHLTLGVDSGFSERAPDGTRGVNFISTGNVVATVVNETATITVVDTSDLAPGMAVTGPGVSGVATVASITDGTHFELSQAIPVGTRDLRFGATALSSASRTPAANTITVVTTAGLTAGDLVTGAGITGTATIISITNGTEFILSQSLPSGIYDLAYGGTVLSSVIDGPVLPVVTIAGAGSGAQATAIVSNGSITGFTITNGGSGYASVPLVSIASPSPSEMQRPFPLRTLLHVADNGTARVLSQVFVGTLADVGNPVGVCTKEAGLKVDEKADAMRFSVSHLPLDRVLDGVLDSREQAGSGGVALPSQLVRTMVVAFDDPTNPFVHQYHPDHDNRDARPDGTNMPKGNGDESYTVTRAFTFTFTTSPPAGISSVGWGSSAIGGTYVEVLRGLHRYPITVSGTFVLRRVSEVGTLTINP